MSGTTVTRAMSQKQVKKGRTWTNGQEYEPNEEHNNDWDALWIMDGSSHMAQVEARGKGKGKALTKGKGAGKALAKGKGKGKGGQLAIDDGNVDEDEKGGKTWKEVLSKAQRARDQCQAAKADCEAAMEQAEKAKRLTKAGRKDTEALLQKLATKVEMVKQLLAKKDKAMKLEKAKNSCWRLVL